MLTFLATDRSLSVRALHFAPVPDVVRLDASQRRHLRAYAHVTRDTYPVQPYAYFLYLYQEPVYFPGIVFLPRAGRRAGRGGPELAAARRAARPCPGRSRRSASWFPSRCTSTTTGTRSRPCRSPAWPPGSPSPAAPARRARTPRRPRCRRWPASSRPRPRRHEPVPPVRRRVHARPRPPGDHHARVPARHLVRRRLRVLPVHRAAPGPGHLTAVRLRADAAGPAPVPQLRRGHRRPAPDGPGDGGHDLCPAPPLRAARLGGHAGGPARPARRVPGPA